MKTKSIIEFECIKGERSYRLEIADQAPLGEAYAAVAEFLAEITRLINEHTQAVAPKQDEAPEAEKVE